MSDLELVISDGPSKGSSIPFPGGRFVIGSAPECQVRFDPKLVQARHAEIAVDHDGNAWVKDLTGAGLVWVNGHASERAHVPSGSFLRLGRLELVVREAGHASPSGTNVRPTPFASKPVPAGSPSGRQAAVRSSAVAPPRSSPTARRPAVTPQGAPVPMTLDEEAVPRREESTAISSLIPPGTVIHGRYKIIGKLAAGGMGEVYRAVHVELGKNFALKVMKPELSQDADFVARFKREAVAASRIGQQNIIDISDFGQTETGRFFFVMEFLEGITLSSLCHREGPQAITRTLNITIQVARALAAAHSQGIVHRDLKPENVMLMQRPGQADFVKVLDFGVAKVTQGQGQGNQTSFGMVVGTPQYMAPEQAKGIGVDARTDIYALGLIIYELLAGRPTFVGETPSLLMVKQVTEQPPPLDPGPVNPVPPELEGLIFSMLAKDPAERPQSMVDVIATMDAVLTGNWAGAPLVSPTGSKALGGGSGGFAAAARQSGKMPAVRASGRQPAVTATPLPKVPRAPTQPGAMTAPVPTAMEAEAPLDDAPMPEEDQLALGPPPSRSPLVWAVLGVVVLGVGGVGAYAYVAGQKPQVVVVEKPVVVPPPILPVKAPDAPPQVAKFTIKFTSEPEKAEVTVDGALVGATPYTVSREENTRLTLRFSAKGYKDETKTVQFTADTEIPVTLEKERAAGPARPAPRPAGLSPENPYEEQQQDLKPAPF